MQAIIDQLLAQNRALLARNAELEQRLANESTDHYRGAWAAVTQALDQAIPSWRDSGPTAQAAAVAAILGSKGAHTLAAFMAVRGDDMLPLLSIVAARAYESKGWSLHPMYMR